MKLELQATTAAEQKIKAYLEENASETLAEKINNGVRIQKDGKTLVSKKTLADFMKFACDEEKASRERRKLLKYSPPKPQPKPQLSMFDMLENSDSSGICATQSEDEPSDEDEEVVEQNVDPETGEILSEEEMQAFDGDIDETIPTVSDIIGDKPPMCRADPALEKEIAAVMDDEQTQNEASMSEDEDDFDISAFDAEAVAVLSELFGDEIELR